jgi:putative MFS transporter
MNETRQKGITLLVIVAALGYFVDVFDLLLFGMVRISSLRGLGVEESLLEPIGLRLDNWQMLGMLLGGIFWGVLGDKKGRLTVLFGSIITYSIANT